MIVLDSMKNSLLLVPAGLLLELYKQRTSSITTDTFLFRTEYTLTHIHMDLSSLWIILVSVCELLLT